MQDWGLGIRSSQRDRDQVFAIRGLRSAHTCLQTFDCRMLGYIGYIGRILGSLYRQYRISTAGYTHTHTHTQYIYIYIIYILYIHNIYVYKYYIYITYTYIHIIYIYIYIYMYVYKYYICIHTSPMVRHRSVAILVKKVSVHKYSTWYSKRTHSLVREHILSQ